MLTGAAPAGGAVVTLSSSNTNVARTPSSVTVAAGATSATFTVSTSVVLASTTVSISGAYGGATRSASLTVTPVPLPPLTLSSLTLSPSSVVGGLQSSTGHSNPDQKPLPQAAQSSRFLAATGLPGAFERDRSCRSEPRVLHGQHVYRAHSQLLRRSRLRTMALREGQPLGCSCSGNNFKT